MKLRFLAGEPAVLAGRSLVVADLHLGIEDELARAGVRLPSGTADTLARLERLVRKARAGRLIVLGDVKNEVPGTSRQEWQELPAFFAELAKRVPVDIVPGNHDVGIARVLGRIPGVTVHGTGGVRIGDVFFTHGHKWPDPAVVGASLICSGHVHPHIEFEDRAGKTWREPAWIAAPVVRERLEEKYKKALPDNRKPKEQTLLLVPAFSDLAGSGVVNVRLEKGHRSPLLRCADLPAARVFLLDGTDLGTLGDLMLEPAGREPPATDEEERAFWAS